MEAHPNEYVQQLLDRAANLITDLESETSGVEDQGSEAKQWLREYHAEKARFGQPLGSPAYADAKRAALGEDLKPKRRHVTQDGAAAAEAGTDTAEDESARESGVPGEDATLPELQDEARRRGLPASGTKADLRARIEDDAHPNARD